MRAEGGRMKVPGYFVGIIISLVLLGWSCSFKAERRSIPVEVEASVGTISDDIANERYEKIYNESSELWKSATTPEQSAEVFKRLRTKLGKVENRTNYSATEQNNSGGPLKGRAFILIYQTKFERGEGMETFTLVERDNRWLLARYFVSSLALT
jgi:hypothetical protein